MELQSTSTHGETIAPLAVIDCAVLPSLLSNPMSGTSQPLTFVDSACLEGVPSEKLLNCGVCRVSCPKHGTSFVQLQIKVAAALALSCNEVPGLRPRSRRGPVAPRAQRCSIIAERYYIVAGRLQAEPVRSCLACMLRCDCT
eukprot:CAMPEP_0178450386 /NCGR_PEP_ID=MMETSP0689_2-20121128/43095_1 /TAXON_ID=160604 /ORGANISM="Amphidinium massartii, Strain CS-259" /LENGTH=141 /DNA_ID=CAMNT_0020075845 /DNA_START=512 /DNA_END=937 /DNA_ORIENTATION=-